jgi:hypothetical protein
LYRLALLFAALTFFAAPAFAHDIPRDVTLQAFAKSEGQTATIPGARAHEVHLGRGIPTARTISSISRMDSALMPRDRFGEQYRPL